MLRTSPFPPVCPAAAGGAAPCATDIGTGVGGSSALCEGWVHSSETGVAADGPGIRYAVFLSGCPLRCLYCHNPDTWQQRDGKLTSVAEILADVARYKGFLRYGHGGVTLSGGEPLAQPEFTAALLAGCKAMGLHTALDTSGFFGAKASDAMLADVDLVLLDIKAFSESSYKRLTGAALKPTLIFARRLAMLNKPVWLRYVLVPGYTDQLDEIAALAEFAARLGNVERVDVLPFHKLGEHKWEGGSQPYRLAAVQPPDAALQETVRGLFRAQGLLTT